MQTYRSTHSQSNRTINTNNNTKLSMQLTNHNINQQKHKHLGCLRVTVHTRTQSGRAAQAGNAAVVVTQSRVHTCTVLTIELSTAEVPALVEPIVLPNDSLLPSFNALFDRRGTRHCVRVFGCVRRNTLRLHSLLLPHNEYENRLPTRPSRIT